LRSTEKLSPTISAKPVGVGAVSQRASASCATPPRAREAFLRLAFAEYRFSNQVNVAIQQNMEVYDPERAELIELRNKAQEARARALADKGASEPLQLADKSGASDAREIALEAESKIAKGVSVEVHDPEPRRLRERPPRTVVERADLQEERMRREGWVRADDSGGEELLD